MLEVYENTEINAELIGWAFVSEYCYGDMKAKYVCHNHKAGTFHFSNDKDNFPNV